jgi:polyisoprenyl-phosphate glycosyltransferase
MASDLSLPYNPIPLISVVSPVYKAEEILDQLVNTIIEELSRITDDYEIILVEDGSPDGSWKKIEENCFKNPRVKGIKFSRNFGQHSAITAGLKESVGDYVVVMDCDLQDNPKYIRTLYQTAKEGYDIVFTSKSKRNHPFLKNVTAKVFFSIFNWLSDTQQATSNQGAFSLITRKVVDAFCKINDAHRHYLMVLRWLGFKSTSIRVEHEKRLIGESAYNWRKLISHAINGITSHSDKLLKLSVGIGLLYFVISLLAIAYLIVMYFIEGYKEGWASTIVLLVFSTGLILMAIGVAGIYIGKIFDQVKERPLYLIDTKINFYTERATPAFQADEHHGDRL